METILALGFDVRAVPALSGSLSVVPHGLKIDLEGIIDGACDLQFVTGGVFAACGVPDVPHLEEVCKANEAKFPNGKAKVNADGKYLKPLGWEPPNHKALIEAGRDKKKAGVHTHLNLVAIGNGLVAKAQSRRDGHPNATKGICNHCKADRSGPSAEAHDPDCPFGY